MKRISILTFIIFMFINSCFCCSISDTDCQIKLIEQETKTYSGEKLSLETRVKNAEIYIFGKEKNGNVKTRLLELSDFLGLPIEENSSETEIAKKNIEPQNETPKPNKKLSKIEKKILGENFDYDELETRIARIEMNFFGKNFDEEDINSRLERINTVYEANKSNTEYKINKFAKYASTGIQIGGIVLLILAMIL